MPYFIDSDSDSSSFCDCSTTKNKKERKTVLKDWYDSDSSSEFGFSAKRSGSVDKELDQYIGGDDDSDIDIHESIQNTEDNEEGEEEQPEVPKDLKQEASVSKTTGKTVADYEEQEKKSKEMIQSALSKKASDGNESDDSDENPNKPLPSVQSVSSNIIETEGNFTLAYKITKDGNRHENNVKELMYKNIVLTAKTDPIIVHNAIAEI